MTLINKYIIWALRIPLAITFLVHGCPKLGGDMGMGFIGYLVGPFEFLGALFILIGPFYKDIMTRLGALMIAIIMLGAIFVVHLPQKLAWNQGDGGVEWQVLLLCVSLFLLVKGNES
jgi:uncharacterized membrane protein YphA (DoxX/SURF4 family)